MHISGFVPFADRGIIIRVETDIRRGIPGVDMSGLAEGAVRESRERVRAAFRNSGLKFPLDRVLINLAPAGVKKEGAALDLPIALSVMTAAGLVSGLEGFTQPIMVLGELELSGRLRPVRAVLAAVAAGIEQGIRFFIVPKENEAEAAVLINAPNNNVNHNDANSDNRNHALYGAAVSSLKEAWDALELLAVQGTFAPLFDGKHNGLDTEGAAVFSCGDFAEVQGQQRCKRALEIAAAGGHNVLIFGVPGTGKTMLARRLPSILAPLECGEAVEVSRIHSLAGQSARASGLYEADAALINRPPFRSPHHSASAEGILGGGRTVRPGEISLAHFGTLFLDEAPEFKAHVLQALREPLEDSALTIVRAEGPLRLPADFQLIMTANACPCGRLGRKGPVNCFCSAEEVRRYWRKFGGALLDRIDIRVPISSSNQIVYGIRSKEQAETSAAIRQRVTQAVAVQQRRFYAAVCAAAAGYCAALPAASRHAAHSAQCPHESFADRTALSDECRNRDGSF